MERDFPEVKINNFKIIKGQNNKIIIELTLLT